MKTDETRRRIRGALERRLGEHRGGLAHPVSVKLAPGRKGLSHHLGLRGTKTGAFDDVWTQGCSDHTSRIGSARMSQNT